MKNEQLQVKHALLAVSDVERIGDHCRNIADMAKDLEEDAFSQSAKDDIEIISNQCYKTLRWALDLRADLDVTKIEKVEKHERKLTRCKIRCVKVIFSALSTKSVKLKQELFSWILYQIMNVSVTMQRTWPSML